MSKLSIWTVMQLNKVFPRPENIENMHYAKLSDEAYFLHEYQETIKLQPEFGPRFNVQDKRVLDVGSGLGGKPVYYAELGAKQVYGIDLRTISCQVASAQAKSRDLNNVLPFVGDASRMPFASESFDVIVSVNVFEHLDDIRGTLCETRRVLRKDGLVFLHFPPFYSPWGAHLENWINIPWPHVFFSEKTLIEVARRIEAVRKNNESYIPTAQVDWAKQERLPELNRITAAEFMAVLRDTGFHIVESHMLPFGRHFLPRRGILGKVALAFLKSLARLPYSREYITTKMVFVLSK
jgi:SAM-dependent methyltransferase